MSLAEMASLGIGGGILILLTLIEITPLKVNPWSAIARGLGKAINGEILKELNEVKKNQERTQKQLEELARVDDERNANDLREKILRFNTELMRSVYHTREDFIEILTVMDEYEKYCESHPDYPNNRATHAVANIERVYDERLRKNDFFKAQDEV